MLQEITFDAMPRSVMAENAHHSRSESYQHVPTRDIVEWLGLSDFVPVQASENRVRKADRFGYQKHMVKFRDRNALAFENGTVSEILVRNSHDGTSGITLWAGMFRFVCGNGLVIANESFQKISIAHRGSDLRNRLINAAHSVISISNRSQYAVKEWAKFEMSHDSQYEFATKALALRFDDLKEAPIHPELLLLAHRNDDFGGDLWRVFNRVQENLTRGGLVGINKKDENGMPQARRLRAIRGSDRNVQLNADLWNLADQFAMAA